METWIWGVGHDIRMWFLKNTLKTFIFKYQDISRKVKNLMHDSVDYATDYTNKTITQETEYCQDPRIPLVNIFKCYTHISGLRHEVGSDDDIF